MPNPWITDSARTANASFDSNGAQEECCLRCVPSDARAPTVPDRHSHSIINEPSKLWICKVLAAASKTFAVTFTVEVPGTSIGAGLRAIRPKVTLRALSTSIGS